MNITSLRLWEFADTAASVSSQVLKSPASKTIEPMTARVASMNDPAHTLQAALDGVATNGTISSVLRNKAVDGSRALQDARTGLVADTSKFIDTHPQLDLSGGASVEYKQIIDKYAHALSDTADTIKGTQGQWPGGVLASVDITHGGIGRYV